MGDAVERDAAEAAAARDAALRGDPERHARGVVHTPAWLAAFVVGEAVRALERVGGDPKLAGATVIDPAVGTGVFPAAVLSLGLRPDRIVGVDVDATAVDAAARVLGAAARDRGVALELRVGDALADARAVGTAGTGGRGGGGYLVDAGSPAVVIGNPPWVARSGSRGVAASDALVAALRPVGERRSGVLSDAYVRFLAWACALVEATDAACAVGLVTNGSFLDGPVHALLRARIAATFDEVRVVDLGGGSLVARDAGARDENVFGVRPPVAITIGARAARPRPEVGAVPLEYARVRGSVADKERALAAPLAWTPIREPQRSFMPAAPRSARWESWVSLAQLFPFHREGVQTNRDALVVDADRDVLLARLQAFARGEHDALAPTRGHFDPVAARRALRAALEDGTLAAHVVRIAYRPFDLRWACVHPAVCHRGRGELRAAMAHGGVALISARQDRGDVPWSHFGAAVHVVDNCWLSTRSSCRARVFPAFAPDGRANVGVLGGAVTAELARGWALGVLSSETYRARHREALRGDYARIPMPGEKDVVEEVARVGNEIARVVSEGSEGESLVRIGHLERRAPQHLVSLLAEVDALVAPLV